jgi:hypothetical protein
MPARHIRSRHPKTALPCVLSPCSFAPCCWVPRPPHTRIRSAICAGRPRRSRAVLITGGCSAPGPASPNRPAKAKWPWRKWNEHAAAINAASDTLARAANSPDEAAPLVIIDTFDACAAAADMMARLYRPAPSPPHDNAAVLGWMRNWLETIPGRCLPLCCASVPITPHVRARHWNP